MSALKKTRFSLADLNLLKTEVECLADRVDRLSRHLLEANIEHTKTRFYDSDVRKQTDRLGGLLRGVKHLLACDEAKHSRYPQKAQTEQSVNV